MLAAAALTACGLDPATEPAADDATTSTATSAASPGPGPTATPAPTTSDAPATTADDAPEVAVEVLDPGTEPRRVLQLSPEAGDTGGLQLRMTMDTSVLLDGQPAQQVDLPPFLMGLSATVDDVTEDTIHLSYTYDEVGLDGPDPGGVQDMLDTMQGLSGTLVTTRSGAFVDGTVDVPAGIHPAIGSTMEQFEQQLASLTVPLPSEPLGVGARWRVTTAFGLNGVEATNIATYELRSLEADAYELAVDLEQRMSPGTIPQAGGSTLEIIEGGGTGSGTVMGSLGFPMAVDGRSEMTTSMVAEIAAAQGQTQRMEQQTSVVLEMTPR